MSLKTLKPFDCEEADQLVVRLSETDNSFMNTVSIQLIYSIDTAVFVYVFLVTGVLMMFAVCSVKPERVMMLPSNGAWS